MEWVGNRNVRRSLFLAVLVLSWLLEMVASGASWERRSVFAEKKRSQEINTDTAASTTVHTPDSEAGKLAPHPAHQHFFVWALGHAVIPLTFGSMMLYVGFKSEGGLANVITVVGLVTLYGCYSSVQALGNSIAECVTHFDSKRCAFWQDAIREQ